MATPVIFGSLRDPPGNFLAWWLAGLAIVVPHAVRAAFRADPDRIVIVQRGRSLVLSFVEGRSSRVVCERVIPDPGAVQHREIGEWRSRRDRSAAEVILLVPEDAVVRKLLNWPLAAEHNLRAILTLEIDRQTPFTADRVLFDYQVRARDLERQVLTLELFVLPVAAVAATIERLGLWGLAPAKIATSGSHAAGLNLLPATGRAAARRRPDWLTRCLAAAALALFIAMLYAPLLFHARVLERVAGEIEARRAEALAVRTMIDERDRLRARSEFLDAREADRLSTIDLTRELTDILPDHTWVDQLTLRGRDLEIHGGSGAATDILPRLENSKYFYDARFRAPVTHSRAAGTDNFVVSATLRTRDPD